MTKKILSFIALFFTFITCFGQYAEVQTGDLLFIGLPVDYSGSKDKSSAFSSSTEKQVEINYIHVAILEVDLTGKTWIIDATIKHGVDRHPLDTFLKDFTLKDGSLPTLDVMRLKDKHNVEKYIQNAKRFCGRQYDVHFLPDNKEKYCSELVRDSYIDDGSYLFSNTPMNFKSSDGTFPPYWVKLFGHINQPIPQGLPGTTPNAMSKEDILINVGKLYTGK